MSPSTGDERGPRPGRGRRGAEAGAGGTRSLLLELLLDALRRLGDHARDLRADLAHLARVRKARLELGVRAAAFRGAALGVLLVFGVCALGASAWLALSGLVGALGALLRMPPWAGSLIVGLGLPALLLTIVLLGKRRDERRQLAELQREFHELERLRREARAANPRRGSQP